MEDKKEVIINGSSFIVVFTKGAPKTKAELQKLLFGEAEEIEDDLGNTISADFAAEIIFRDMQINNPRDINEKIIMQELQKGDIERYLGFSIWKFKNKSGKIDWQAYNQAYSEAEKKFLKNWLNLLPQDCKEWYLFDYREDSNIGRMLERASVFNNVVHIQVNKR